MSSIPWTRFEGSLKQLLVGERQQEERALFSALFPRFFDKSDWSWDDSEAKRSLESIPKVVLAEPKLPRRFGGYVLPRGRYYTVCVDPGGDDHWTLGNELRAYRDPVRTGMVEVVDFGIGDGVLALGDRIIETARSPELGVLIHEPQRLRALIEPVPHEELESSDGKVVVLVKFFYRIAQVTLSRTVDLREPLTRDWFFEQFSEPNEDWIWPERMKADGAELLEPPMTIVSSYEKSPGRAPAPRTFFEMLPTLLNPIRGGGDHAWGGSTLMAIGEWLRNRDVEALIYPAARSDTYVIYEAGEQRDFGGWCAVDYRHDGHGERAHYVVIDSSPWSWVALPRGVTIRAGDERSRAAGTLQIEGLVARSTKDYLEHIACLRAAGESVGPLGELGQAQGRGETWSATLTTREAFALGTFVFRWMHLACASLPEDDILFAFRVSRGLALRCGLEQQAAEMAGVYSRLAGDGEAAPAMEKLALIAVELQNAISAPQEINNIIGGAIDLELALLVLTRLSLAGQTTLSAPLSADGLRQLSLPDVLKAQVDAFLRGIETTGSGIQDCSRSGVALARDLAQHYG